MNCSRKLMLFCVIYIVCFIYSFFFSTVYNDEIWNYGFAYNIASGLVPYRDFGMLQTPLYFFLASLFIKIFGSYLFSFHLFNSIILASIIYIILKKLGYRAFILIPLVLLNCYPGYNIFSVLILLLILNLLDKKSKYKDYLIGMLVGVMFLTKQHLGICLFVPLIYYSRNKLKSIIGFISPVILLIIYLIFNGALYEFFDYSFLGIFDFGNSNSILLFFPIELFVCLVMLYKLFKSKFNNDKLFYILMYQIVTVPIFDDYHFMIGFIPILYYFLENVDIANYKIKYYFIMSLTFFVCWNFKAHQFNSLNFYSDRDSYLYGRNIPKYVTLDDISDYMKDKDDVYDHIYFFSRNAYYVKLNIKYPLDKFDMICNGNMGFDGSNRYIREVDEYCSSNSCMFILYKYEFENEITQTNKEIVNHVVNNYNFKEEISWFDIYTN